MNKCRVIEEFSLDKFKELKEIVRAVKEKDEEGKLYKNDTFLCDDKMADYLTGNNSLNKTVVEIIESIPEQEESKLEEIEKTIKEEKPKKEVEEKPAKKKTTTRRKTTKRIK